MAYGRSSAIERFRSHAGSIFPDIDATLFQKSKKRSQDPQICKLLGLSGDPHKDKTPPMLAPVLFKDEDTRSMSKLFRSSALFQVCSIPIDSSKKSLLWFYLIYLGLDWALNCLWARCFECRQVNPSFR